MRRCTRKLFEVLLPEFAPLLRVGVEPLAQLVGRCEVLQPRIERGVGLLQTPWPEPVHEHARTVFRRRFRIHAFEDDRHARYSNSAGAAASVSYPTNLLE